MATIPQTFLIQVQPARFEFMTERDVVDIADRIKEHWPESTTVTTGDDNGGYVNIFLESTDPSATWLKLQRSFIDSKLPGGEFRKATIITATGADGWNDYLLLHHYDDSESLDSFPGDK